MQLLGRQRWMVIIGSLAVLLLVFASCGGSDDEPAATDGTGDPKTDTSEAEKSADGIVLEPSNVPEEFSDAEPVYGGEIVYGLEAETALGFSPPTTQCAVSCLMIMRAIFEPLAIETEDGKVVPNLLESWEPNADYSEWTFTMRDGIKFHDGTPADGAALARHFEELVKPGTISVAAIKDLKSIEQTGPLSVKVTLNGPWVELPSALTAQLGYLPAPSQYDDPDGKLNPVGTGPFRFVSWTLNDKLVVERNPDYWRSDAKGNKLPYLDRVEFRPIPDTEVRMNAFENGEIDAMHVGQGEFIADLREDPDIKLIEGSRYGETNYILLNNASPPLDDVNVRRALAQCTDAPTIGQLQNAGVFPVANGPFQPGTPGYLEDTGFPEFDPEAGKAALSAFGPVSIELGATADPHTLRASELIAKMWEQCGAKVSIKQVDQGTLITDALLGNFQAFIFRNHGGVNVDNQYIWWSSFTSGDIGSLAINFGRINDPVIDKAFDDARKSPEEADRVAAAETINRAFADQVHNIWYSWTTWGIAADPSLQNLTKWNAPDGEPTLPILNGRHFLTEAWIKP